MRPGSSGMRTGMPPGTGMDRPGSGRRPPGSARLKTGVATGAVTQAAVGVALNTSINVSDRPVTGQGVTGMKGGGAMQPGRLVEDASYYVGLIRKKINDVNGETNNLRKEIDQQSRDSNQYSQLERRYETLIKNKENLEGELADYNLALDKTRTSTDPEDVRHMCMQVTERNRQVALEVDKIFTSRKQREKETAQLEEQIENYYRSIQNRINDLEPAKLRAYEDLHVKQKELNERAIASENKLNEINAKIERYESNEKGNSYRKEYSQLEKQINNLSKDASSLREELAITNLDPKEAHAKFVERVKDNKQATENMSNKIEATQNEVDRLRKTLDDIEMPNGDDNSSSNDDAKYELLQKRDQDMSAFMDNFDASRDEVLVQTKTTKDTIVALLEHISQGLDSSTSLPTQEALGEMKDNKSFKEKNLATAERTMASLQAEHRKREKEMEILKSSEPKLERELTGLRESMSRMLADIEEFKDIDGLRRRFEQTQQTLQEQRRGYIKRRDAMRQQVQAVSTEHEHIKRTLNNNDTAKDLEDMEKNLRQKERTIFDLHEFVESKTRETDYESIKGGCLKMLDNLNRLVIKNADESDSKAQLKY